MTKRNILLCILLIVVTLGVGCGKLGVEPGSTPAVAVNPTLTVPPETIAPTPTPEPTPAPVVDPVEELLAGMTTEQKVGQLLVAGIDGYTPGDDGAIAIRDYQVGGIILFGRNVESANQLATLTNDLKGLNGDHIPLFLCVDEEGGRVSRMPPEVRNLPSPYRYIKDGGDADAWGRVLAEACKTFGFNVDFAPSLDIWSNPDNTVIGDRAFGNDMQTVIEAGSSATYSMMRGGVIPAVKHFPGHGDTLEDSHKELPVVNKSFEEWAGMEAQTFGMVLDKAGPKPMVMVGHILMPQIDPDYPASLSYKFVTEILREWLMADLVCTDDLTMGAISNTYGMGEAAVLAVEAGCDLLLVCHKTENLKAAYDGLLAAVDSGRITGERLDESVRRILTVKGEYGVTGEPVDAPDVAGLNEKIGAILP